jgi:sulfur dioxygenase
VASTQLIINKELKTMRNTSEFPYMIFHQLFDEESATFTYFIANACSRKTIVIDPVKSKVDEYLKLICDENLILDQILDTHVHADHITGGGLLAARTGVSYGLSAKAEGKHVDWHLKNGDEVHLCPEYLVALETPGHTRDSMVFVNHDKSVVFTGDTMLIGACGRTDFQNGSSQDLYNSITKVIYALPDDCIIFPGHDYNGQTQTTVGEQKRFNKRIRSETRRIEFVEIMNNLNLPRPKLMDIAVPFNLNAGFKPVSMFQY